MGKKLILCIVIILMSSIVIAIDDPKIAVTEDLGSGSFDETGSQTGIAVEGGNVTTLNISTTASTSRWQGFVGNVTGSLGLGRGTSILFDFGEADFESIFATTSASPDWSNLQASVATDIDSQWGFTAGADQAVDAFTGSDTIQGMSVPSVSLTGSFLCGLFQDRGVTSSKDHFVFGAPVYTPAKVGFDNGFYNYELIVPTEDNSETYYLYLSLKE